MSVLRERDRRDLVRLMDADPYVNVVAASRLRAAGLAAPGSPVLGVRDADGTLTAAALHGGNLLPVGGAPEQWRALGSQLAGRRRGCTAIVGRDGAVEGVWQVLEPEWGPARAWRVSQPLLVLDRSRPLPPGDPRLRAIRPAELDRYLPAAAEMFTEELGVSPYRAAVPGAYRRRVAALIGARRAFGIVEDGAVLFKADLGATSAYTCQVQGVWVRPDLRGRGLGRVGLAGVLRHALTLAPTASLYVNDFNVAARRLYASLGMRQVATLASVLL